MNFGKQKELAARALKVSKKRIKFNLKKDEDRKAVKELISREGVRELYAEKIIKKLPKKGNSRTRANYIKEQKKRGRRKGIGSRKGTANARFKEKKKWMIKIRALRAYLKELKDSGRLSVKNYRDLYRKAKGNLFRNKKHLKLFIEQNKLLEDVKKGKEVKKDEK